MCKCRPDNIIGKEFVKRVEQIYKECANLGTPERAARVTAFSILVMLDGSGEACDCPNYTVFVDDERGFSKVMFHHHDLE